MRDRIARRRSRLGGRAPIKRRRRTQEHYTIVVKNSGHYAWPAGTELAVGSGSASPLYDPSWKSQTVVTSIAAAIAIGAHDDDRHGRDDARCHESTPITQTFELDAAGTKFGTIDLALTVAPDADADQPGDGNEPDDGDGSTTIPEPARAAITPAATRAAAPPVRASFAFVALVLALVAIRRRARRC